MSGSNEDTEHGTLETAILETGEKLPCPAEKVIRQEKWESNSLVIWYEHTDTEQSDGGVE